MNRGGHTNQNRAPVEAFAPAFPHKLNTEGSDHTMIEAMTEALKIPAFDAKWGDALRAKHPVLAQKHSNAAASAKINGRHSISAGDSSFTKQAADEVTPETVAEVRDVLGRIKSICGMTDEESAESTAQAAIAAALAGEQVSESVDGNFVPRGFEQTPYDAAGTAVALGEQQRQGDPLVAAGLDDYLAGEQSATGGKGVNSRAFEAGKTEKPRDIAPLFVDLAAKAARLKAALTRNGGIPRVKPTVTGRQGVKGVRGMDANQRAAMDSAKASDNAYLAAHNAMAEGMPGSDIAYPTYWDKTLGMFRPVRG